MSLRDVVKALFVRDPRRRSVRLELLASSLPGGCPDPLWAHVSNPHIGMSRDSEDTPPVRTAEQQRKAEHKRARRLAHRRRSVAGKMSPRHIEDMEKTLAEWEREEDARPAPNPPPPVLGDLDLESILRRCERILEDPRASVK